MYKLSDIVLERINRPKAMILAGSPGAGKSSFIEDVNNALIMNIDDIYIRNLQKMGVSLDLKNANAEERSKAASAFASANKEFRPQVIDIIRGKKNFVLDTTSANTGTTLRYKQQLEELGYEVLMVYVFASLEKALDRNETRFQRSQGKDRSLLPSLVLRTWNSVTQNYDFFKKEFGNNFISVVNDKALKKGAPQKSLKDLVATYIDPYKPTNTKPKTDKQQQRSNQQKAELNKQITDFINSDKVEDIKSNSVSKDEAKSKVKQFFS